MRLQGKVALVTGAGTGIGRAIALEFARQGAKIFIAELNEEAGRVVANEIAALGSEARQQHCDVSLEEDVQAAVRGAVESFGRLDIAVNNAGVAQRDWDTTIAVNLSGVYHGCRYAAEAMAVSGGGSIVNLASILGLVGVGAEHAYVAAKHGVVGLTKNFAIAYGTRAVRVNCISPGWIETAMTSIIRDSDALKQTIEQQTPLGRFGTPEEVAKVALFLASDESSFVTGSAYIVDGGWTAR